MITSSTSVNHEQGGLGSQSNAGQITAPRYCGPCFERKDVISAVHRIVAGIGMCRECFSGGGDDNQPLGRKEDYMGHELYELRRLVERLRDEVMGLKRRLRVVPKVDIDPAIPGAPSLEDIKKAVYRHFDINGDSQHHYRGHAFVRMRHIAGYIARSYGYSLPQIGRGFGGQNHTTVLYGCRKIVRELKGSNKLRKQLDAIKAEIHSNLSTFTHQ